MLELEGNINGFSDYALEINNYLSSLFNGLAGQSVLFDNLVELLLKNNLVKAEIVGTCFFCRVARET